MSQSSSASQSSQEFGGDTFYAPTPSWSSGNSMLPLIIAGAALVGVAVLFLFLKKKRR